MFLFFWELLKLRAAPIKIFDPLMANTSVFFRRVCKLLRSAVSLEVGYKQNKYKKLTEFSTTLKRTAPGQLLDCVHFVYWSILLTSVVGHQGMTAKGISSTVVV